MKTYRVVDISFSGLNLFIDDEYEGEDSIEVKEEIMCEIMDNIGNYIDIELEEIDEDLKDSDN